MVLSAIDVSKAIWMDVGILYIDAVASDGDKKVLKLEVYVTDLNSDRYAQVNIKTPSVLRRAYKLPCHWVSSGGCPKLIIGNSFLNKFPHVRVANYDGLTLNKSSISGNYFVQGALKGHQIEECNREATIIKSNKVTLAPLDREFLQYNFIQDLNVTKPC